MWCVVNKGLRALMKLCMKDIKHTREGRRPHDKFVSETANTSRPSPPSHNRRPGFLLGALDQVIGHPERAAEERVADGGTTGQHRALVSPPPRDLEGGHRLNPGQLRLPSREPRQVGLLGAQGKGIGCPVDERVLASKRSATLEGLGYHVLQRRGCSPARAPGVSRRG